MPVCARWRSHQGDIIVDTAKGHPRTNRHAPASEPLRYAHPYYTPTPPQDRPALPTYGRRALDWSSQQVGPIPAPRGPAVITLDHVTGAPGPADLPRLRAILLHS